MEFAFKVSESIWSLTGFEFDCTLNPFFHDAVVAFFLEVFYSISSSCEKCWK